MRRRKPKIPSVKLITLGEVTRVSFDFPIDCEELVVFYIMDEFLSARVRKNGKTRTYYNHMQLRKHLPKKSKGISLASMSYLK